MTHCKWAPTFHSCLHTAQETHNTLLSAGFLPSDKKLSYIPSQTIEILGFIINSVEMAITLPHSKITSLVTFLDECLSLTTLSIHTLAKIIGKLISCLAVLPLGHLYYRPLEQLKITTLNANNFNYSAPCTLTQECRNCILWCENASQQPRLQ